MTETGLGVVTMSPRGRVEYVSDALQKMLGVTAGDFRDRTILEVLEVRGEDGVRLLAPEDYPLNRALDGDVVADALLTVRTGDDRLLYLRCNAAPLRDPFGNITAAVALLQDVTSELAVRREQDELRARLIETINHEFRTPLTKLFGHAELLEEAAETLDPATLRKSIGAVLDAAGDLRDFLQVLSGLVDLETHTRLNPRFGDVVQSLAPVVATCSDQAKVRGVTLVTDLPERLHVTLDHDETARAVREVLVNAIQHAPRGSEVVLRVSQEGSCVELEVCDAGPGIPEADLRRVLEPFERGIHPDEPLNGRGLGLPIANTVATAHGGRLTLESNDPVGLRARLSMPRGRSHTTTSPR